MQNFILSPAYDYRFYSIDYRKSYLIKNEQKQKYVGSVSTTQIFDNDSYNTIQNSFLFVMEVEGSK